MELSINISGQGPSQRDERLFQKWMEEFFPPDLPVPGDAEPKKMMDEDLYEYAKRDRFNEFFCKLQPVSSSDLSSIIYSQVDPSGNSLLHVAARHGSKDVTELLLHHFPLLITMKNFQDDTALHLAARAGQLRTSSILINKAKGNGGASGFDTFMEKQNNRGNTALHDAVIERRHDVVRFLVSEHSILSCMKNNEHKSSLYLAVENSTEEHSDDQMLAILMAAIPDKDDVLAKLEGKSPVQAAVKGRKKNILKQIANKKRELLHRKDEEENPLHQAASMGYVFGTQFLFDEYRDGAIQRNSEGNLPIHVASKNGHIDVVDVYISKWTDPTTFVNSKGQNILHVAAESGRNKLVKYMLKNEKLRDLVNEKDHDGNTPLHLASKNGQYIATFILVRNNNVKRKIANGENLANSENLTPYEVAEKQSKIAEADYSGEPIPKGKDHQVDQKNDKDGVMQQPKSKLDYYGVMMTLSILHFFAGPKSSIVNYFRIQNRPIPKEEVKNRITTLLVVAVLIVGVTFAGVLQLPKSEEDSENEGISGGNERILRDVYIYLDLIAFNASVMASIILCWAQLIDDKVAVHAVWLASILTGGAIYLMCLAFMFAVAIGVSKSSAFFVVALVVGGVLVLVQTVVSAPLIIPPKANQIIERVLLPYFYFSMFICYFVFEWLVSNFSDGSDSSKEKKGPR